MVRRLVSGVVCVVLLAFGMTTLTALTSSATAATVHVGVQHYVTQGPCVPAVLSLRNRVVNTPEAFTVTVTATRPVCDPVDVKAVVYAMPGNKVAWPQTLVTATPFTIDKAGVYTVEFTKGCDPAQFDLIVGDTPDTISPAGQWHGPMLFPVDSNTALQWWGKQCPVPTTTGTSSTTTTSTTVTTTTTTVTTSTTTVPVTTTIPVEIAPPASIVRTQPRLAG